MANVRRAQARHDRQWNRWLTIVGYGGLGLGCLLLAAATFVFLAAPVDLVRDRLVQDIKARTGRDLVVAGATSLVLFPRLAVSFANVALSAPPGMGGEPTLRVQTLEAELGLLSLLSQQAGIKRLVLSRPTIELRVDAQGRRSWEFATAEPRSVRSAQAAVGGAEGSSSLLQVQYRQPAASGAQLAAEVEKLVPASVSVIDGTVRYIDERAGVRHEIQSLDLELAVNDIGGPLAAKGSLGWRGERVGFVGALSPVRALLQEQKARLTLELSGRSIEAHYDGALDVVSGLALDGLVSLKAPSLQAVGNLLGSPVDAGQDPGALNLSSSLTSAGGQVSLSRLTLTVGDTSLNGEVAIETKGARPRLSGTLQLSELDLGRILVRPGPPAAAPPAARRQSDPIEDILRRKDDAPAKAPQVRGFTKRAGGGSDWSDDLIDFSPLGLADADLKLTVGRVVHKDIKTGPSRLSLELNDKVASITLEELQLYGGRGRGRLTLDGSGPTPVTGANLTLQGVSALPLLKDALGFDWLEGRSTITLALAGQGVSERQMVETLNGKVDLATASGALNGIDVDKQLRNIEQGRFTDIGFKPGDKTQFSEFAATFVIANGVAQNQDLRLVSPRVRVTGQGSVNLAQRQLDYTVNPKIAGGVAAPGAVINVKNLEIPVHISGSWDKPSFSIKGQEQIIEAVKEIGKNIKSKDVEDALKGLFGGGDGERVKPRDLLEKFLKK
jgi:AsmA protein